MAAHIFKSHVWHDKEEFVKGQACPDKILADMQKKGLVEPLPEAVKPVQPAHKAEPAKK